MLLGLIFAIVVDDIPRALAELEKTRAKIQRADIEWERTDFRGSFVPGVPKRYRSAFTEGETAFFAEGTAAQEGIGAGVTAWTADGEPVYESRYANLATSKNRWSFESDYLIGKMWEDPKSGDRDADVRLIGVMPVPNLDAGLATLLRGRQDGPPRTYRESVVDGVHVVECVFDGGEEKYVWFIDPAKDWNCLRAQAVVKGSVVAESFTDYQQAQGGAWFPAAVDYFAANMELLVHIDVTSARINSSDLPDRLTPEFIGLGSCMQVTAVNAEGTSGTIMDYVADGRLATLPEYDELLRTGQTTVDPRLKARAEARRSAREAQRAADDTVAKRVQTVFEAPASQPADEWEKYTLDFIRRYSLDSDQSQRAMSVLLPCQQRRDAYLKSREATLAKLGKELLVDRDAERRKRLEARLELLRKPVDEIFERQLKPRLEKLPTRKQIEAAAPASPPAVRPTP